ncbi:hypothetical protein VTK73DRAFT_134 [Phialemonium thermophilum]|uniref:Uncharacterized protein n=1 Tax=Phialemonium thermophilum TaxID=223376 RepID=A0ABR3Y463_9PEZI
MPLPTAASTTTADQSTSTTEPDTNIDEKPELQASGTEEEDWYEPHPGVPVRLEGSGLGLYHSGGSFRGGMAAKGYGPSTKGRPTGVARRHSRPRIRVRSLKSSTHTIDNPPIRRISSDVPDQSTLGGAIFPTSSQLVERIEETSTATLLGKTSCERGESNARDSCSLREDANVELSTNVVMTPSSPGFLSTPSLCFTDFSNFTGMAAVATNGKGDRSDSTCTTVCGQDVTDTAPEIPSIVCNGTEPGEVGATLRPDAYGWDAEFERKVSTHLTLAPCAGARKAGFRRGLQRVFSFGG